MDGWKARFFPARVREALAGNPGVLLHAFPWAQTPEGAKFWGRQSVCLTEEGRVRLRAMLEEAEPGGTMTPERALDELAREAQRQGLYDGSMPVLEPEPGDWLPAAPEREPEPTVTVPRIEGNRRADYQVPARVHETEHNLGLETGMDDRHRMGFSQDFE